MSVLAKYNTVLKMAKDKIDELKAPFKNKEMQKKAELEVIKLEANIAEKEQKIQELAAKYPINFNDLLDALDDLELTQRRLKQFNEIIADLFGEEDAK